MLVSNRITVTEVFEKKLRQLGLEEFPCGYGSWRENPNKKRNQQCSKKFQTGPHTSGIKKDKTPLDKHVDTLLEYVHSENSPWNTDCSWSSEALNLREIAITNPQWINDKFVFNFFKTLTLRNSSIQEIDSGVLKFSSLEEFNLNVNYIANISPKNLPPSLKRLELSANKISDLTSLCDQPPPLIHLGLSYNTISYIDKHFTKNYWPQLLSLDLLHNDLCDLRQVVKACSYLPKLQSLVLVGNPLSLVTGYRGFVIASLPLLVVLDYITIRADERFHFKDLQMYKDHIENVAVIIMNVPSISGIPMPQEMKPSFEMPENTVIQKTYSVQVVFLSEEEDSNTMSPEDQNQKLVMEKEFSLNEFKRISRANITKSKLDFRTYLEKMQARFSNATDIQSHKHSLLSSTDTSPMKTITLCTESLPWTENEIIFNWEAQQKYNDLLLLRDYLYRDIEISVIERKLIGHEIIEESDDDKNVSNKDKKKGRKLDKKPDKGKKMRKSGRMDFIKWLPPEDTSLAKFYLNIESFIKGNHNISTRFSYEISDTFEFNTGTDRSKQIYKKEDKLKRPLSRASQVSLKNKNAGALKKKGKPAKESPEDMMPTALEFDFTIRLHDWTSTEDCITDASE
ncbi:leucine-rich repeat-containing protein 43-like isoform X2 [Octopus sinensis]|uniref:Leucine-rich repeat-containing protein 43-like isoform X2 n=1 Tax=Octopus sinensis TaxID=2607531 RepID=A0A7E6ESE1_9MOLL|nr:leucine-rich repeat-containing protein 43-like isoform X2 [Octopus sinensis]